MVYSNMRNFFSLAVQRAELQTEAKRSVPGTLPAQALRTHAESVGMT